MTEDGNSSNKRERKVVRIMRKYDLENLEVKLINRWSGKGEEDFTIRELAQWFNTRVVERAMEDHNVDFDGLAPSAETVYEALNASEPDDQQQMIREALRERGLPVDEVADDLTHWRSVYAWVREDKGVEGSNSRNALSPHKAQEQIDKFLNRTETVSESSLERLANSYDHETPEFNVTLRFRVECENCNRSVTHTEWIQSEGCPNCARNVDSCVAEDGVADS